MQPETNQKVQEQSGAVAQLSPMMRQYWDVKSQHPDALLFFRVGDFYELFDADSQVAARELDITLTSRPEPSYPNGRCPMAGVPVRAADLYLARLVGKGYSVAICDQIGVAGQEKGPIERQVTRILTPGTVLESHLLPARENNYLVALCRDGDTWGLACVDAACGEFVVTQLKDDELALELGRLSPSEILVAKKTIKPGPNEFAPREVLDVPEGLQGSYRFTGRPAMFFQFEPAQRRILQYFGVKTLEGFGCQSSPLAVSAAGAALEYLERTQASQMPKFNGISTYSADGHLVIDANTRRNLELTETSRDRSFDGSLLWTLDKTQTGMGSRMLRKWLLKPLYSVPEIRQRQDALEELLQNHSRSQTISNALSKLSDLERLAVRITSLTICPKDLVAVQGSLQELPTICSALAGTSNAYLSALSAVPDELIEFSDKIANSIAQDAPRELTEGSIFVRGFNSELDELRDLLGGGKEWIENYQRKEQERTGIKSLKVNFNRTFGYYIEVTHSNKGSVPDDYIRKQTLTNAERFITPELKEYEAKILNAEKNVHELEYKLFINLRQEITAYGVIVGMIANSLAQLDALLSLAAVAIERKYVKPVVDNSLVVDIKQGRHPVLEQILPMGQYVANDCYLEGQAASQQMIILTGPNMSGKSSLLRQVAHIVVLAQMGSFVPAESARIGIVDRIFTRIGAVDDLTQGQSTFLVEMSETTQCCLSASERSLILLDEVGRGTSTYDGVAIAWSVAEYLAKDVQARTIFATHYHELNGLASFFPQIANYQVMVKEVDGRVEFIRSIMPGGASKSFGIQVARMAGMPQKVIERAQALMLQMEKKSAARQILDGPKFRNIQMDEVMQLSVFETAELPAVDASPELAGKS
ncbi:MAG TPA: DNA mismatch repair protein MutS [Oculatellaceae cyanobacterium]